MFYRFSLKQHCGNFDPNLSYFILFFWVSIKIYTLSPLPLTQKICLRVASLFYAWRLIAACAEIIHYLSHNSSPGQTFLLKCSGAIPEFCSVAFQLQRNSFTAIGCIYISIYIYILFFAGST